MTIVFLTVNKYECVFSLMRTFMFLPFFMIGFYMNKDTLAGMRKASSKVVFSILYILVTVGIIRYAGPKYRIYERWSVRSAK